MTEASVTWVDGLQFMAQSGTGHALAIDSTVAGGGAGSAPNPMELMLMSILGCTAIDVISILKKKRQPVLGLKVFATGEQVEDYPHRFHKIHLEYVATGAVQLEALERSIQLSEEKYCSAMATVRGQVEITHSARVEPAPPQLGES